MVSIGDPPPRPNLINVWKPFRPKDDGEIGAQRADAEARLAALGAAKPVDYDRFVASAQDGYEEQDRRADRSEQRATTLLGAVGFSAPLITALGALLAGSNALGDDERRLLATGAVVVLGCFLVAVMLAWRTLTIGDAWRRPSTPDMISKRAAKQGGALKVDYAAALYDSAWWNQHLADRHVLRVRWAGRFFGLGIAALFAFGIALVTIAGASGTPTAIRGEKGDKGDPGDPGRSIVQKANVRVVLAAPRYGGRAGCPLPLRFAVTKPGSISVQFYADRHLVATTDDVAAVGPNRTEVVLPAPGRYGLHIAARAANGTQAQDDAVLVVRRRRGACPRPPA
jgi:hypothetical protein